MAFIPPPAIWVVPFAVGAIFLTVNLANRLTRPTQQFVQQGSTSFLHSWAEHAAALRVSGAPPAVPLPRLLADRPMSRACIVYAPRMAPRNIKEALGFVESWKSIMFNPLPEVESEGQNLNETDQLYGFYNTKSELVLPWMEKARRQLHTAPLADPEQLKTVNDEYAVVPPDGPPLVTDVLVVTSMDFDLEADTHPLCTGLSLGESPLESLAPEELRRAMNVTARVHAAQEKLRAAYESMPAAAWPSRPMAPRRFEASWGESRCFYIRARIPTEAMESPFMERHKAMNSIGCLASPGIAHVARDYDLLLRSDADCFLLPHFNDPRLIPWKLERRKKVSSMLFGDSELPQRPDGTVLRPFWAGAGGYSGVQQNEILRQYAAFLGLRHQGVHSVGSTWYGHTRDVLEAGALSIMVGEFLLRYDPLFKLPKGNGEWPFWFRGVVSMYSGEVTVNHLIHSSRLIRLRSLIDDGSTSNKTITEKPVVHVHCWHTGVFYSKFRDYPPELALSPVANILQPSWYSLFHSLAGRAYKGKRAALTAAGHTTPEPDPTYEGHLIAELVPLVDPYFGCPKTHPYAYHNGTYCCVTPVDCRGTALNYGSDCCKDYKHRACPVGSGCFDAGTQRDVSRLMRFDLPELQEHLRSKFASLRSDGYYFTP